MIEEQARVVAVDDGIVEMQVQRRTACDACSVNKGCGTGVLAKAIGVKPMRIQARSALPLSVGDTVIVGIEDQMLVRSSFLVYALPLLMLLAGAFFGDFMARNLVVDNSDVVTIAGGIGGLMAGFFWLRVFSLRMAADSRYQPRILRRLEQPSPGYTLHPAP